MAEQTASKTGTEATGGRRQRTIERRRRRIVEAAARVFSENGYAATTTRAIAQAADMAEGTIYNYFDSKRDILLAVARETANPMAQSVAELESLETRPAMIAMMERAFSFSEAQFPFARTLLHAAWLDDGILEEFLIVRLRLIHQVLEAFISTRIAAGEFRAVDPAIGARVAIGMFATLILPVLRGVEPMPSPDQRRALTEEMADFILDGIRARPSPQEPAAEA